MVFGRSTGTATAQSPRLELTACPVYVLFTTEVSVKRAMAFATALCQPSPVNIEVLAVNRVDYRLPLERPAVAESFFKRKVVRTVLSFGPRAAVTICFARTVLDGCRHCLPPGAALVVGQEQSLLPRLRQKLLMRRLSRAGFQILIVP